MSKKTEGEITDEILLEASNQGARLFRQNVGLGWVGKILKRSKTQITIENPRPLHAGLCVGSGDIVGITPVVITQDMVGETVGVFTSVEVKTEKGKARKAQLNWFDMIKKLGGIAMIAKSQKDFMDKMERFEEEKK